MDQYGVKRVFNADQTAVFFEMLPKKTVSTKGTQTVWVKCGQREKQQATAMLLADSDGNKYAPFLVYKVQGSKIEATEAANMRLRHGFGVEMWKEIQDIQAATGTQIYGNRTAWWNSDLTIAWLDHFFGDRNQESEPVLLLLDSFSGHWTDGIEEYAARLNVIMKSVPPRLTWRFQPADVAWMKPLKDGLRRRWVEHLRQQLARRKDGGGKFVMRPPDRGDVAEWLTEGWIALPDSIIVSGFTKCGFVDAAVQPVVIAPPCDEELCSLVDQLCAAGWADARVGEVCDRDDMVDSQPTEIINV